MLFVSIAKQKSKICEWIWKNLNLSSNLEKQSDYYFILEGDYFCVKKQATMLVLRARNQRNVLIRPIQEIAYNNELIQILCPMDTFIIGVLANKERNGFKEPNYDSTNNMRRLKNKACAVRLNAILQITKTNFDQSGLETVSIYSPAAKKEIDISIPELFENKALLYGLDPMQALSLGYSVCEWWIRHQVAEDTYHVTE